MPSLLALVLLSANCQAAPLPALPAAQFQALLQRFVSFGYGRAFDSLGDERDFDHGHVLVSPKTGRPVAILYHTRELSPQPPAARNWLQWIDGGGIEDARRYERKDYPRSGAWDWFRLRELPRLLERKTILDKMLDPSLFDASRSAQWTFTRVDCGAGSLGERQISVRLPDGAPVCLALGS